MPFLPVLLLFAAGARALPLEFGGDSYQAGLARQAMALHKLELEPLPEGKTIERIELVPYEIFIEHEYLPRFVNALHVTTRAEVIEREILFATGETWRPALIDETERNLRENLFVSVARVLACRGSAPDRVVALVITKDLWSLRLNQNWAFIGPRLELLELELVEANLLGRTISVGPLFRLDQGSYSLGETLLVPRLLGSRWEMAERARAILARDTGRLEGGVAILSVERPLYSLSTRWAYGFLADLRADVVRLFQGGKLASFQADSTGESIPYAYRRRVGELRAKVTRSLGEAPDLKHSFAGGWRAIVKSSSVPGTQLPATAQEFRAEALPRSERAGMLFAAYSLYRPDYVTRQDIDSFAITEDFRLGPDFGFETRFAHPVFLLDSRYSENLGRAAWTWMLNDNFFTLAFSAGARYQPGAHASTPWVNRAAGVKLRNVTPELAYFRMHFQVQVFKRSFDLDNAIDTLGGESGLRGYPSRYLKGAQYWVANLEGRSRPVALWSAHLGAVVFMDLGDAAETASQLKGHTSAGAGLRLVLPQFNREPIRLDFAVPLEKVNGDAAYVVLKFGQAF